MEHKKRFITDVNPHWALKIESYCRENNIKPAHLLREAVKQKLNSEGFDGKKKPSTW